MDSLLLSAVPLLFVCFLLFSVLGPKKQRFSLPPSPPALPVIGHLHLLQGLAHHSMMELAKRYGDIMFLKLGSLNTLVVSSPEAAKLVLKTLDPDFAMRAGSLEAKYASYGGQGVIFADYGEHWRQARKLCTLQLLSTKKVELARPSRKMEMAFLLEDLWKSAQSGSVANLTSKLSDFTFNVMIKMVAGKSCSGSTQNEAEGQQALDLKNAIIEFVREGNGVHLASFFPWFKWFDRQVYKLEAVHKRLNKILQNEVNQHRQNLAQPGHIPDDFIDIMLAGGEFDDNCIKAISGDVLAASTDTGSVTAEWAISELLNHPDALAKAQAELDEVIGRERTMEESDIPSLEYLRAVVSETLRLHPPLAIFFRENSDKATMLGSNMMVPGKTRLYINAYAIGRNEALWKEPHHFKPERFLLENANIDVRGQDFQLIPFGGGRRICPGMQLGLINVMLMVGSLLHAFNWTTPDHSGKVDIREHCGLTVGRELPLELLPVPRLPTELYSTN